MPDLMLWNILTIEGQVTYYTYQGFTEQSYVSSIDIISLLGLHILMH